MHTYMHTYMQIHTYMHTHIYRPTCIRTYTGACIHTHIHKYIYTYTHTSIYILTYITHTYIHRYTGKCYVQILRSLFLSLSVLDNAGFNSLHQQETSCPPKLINRHWKLLSFLCDGDMGFFFGCQVVWA